MLYPIVTLESLGYSDYWLDSIKFDPCPCHSVVRLRVAQGLKDQIQIWRYIKTSRGADGVLSLKIVTLATPSATDRPTCVLSNFSFS